jgi:hypothetical protein
MHCDIDRAVKQRQLNFLGENSFAGNRVERPVVRPVTLGLDLLHHNRPAAGQWPQLVRDEVRLP